jgi:hypothetical protein
MNDSANKRDEFNNNIEFYKINKTTTTTTTTATATTMYLISQ